MEKHVKNIVYLVVGFSLFAFTTNIIIDNPYTHRLLRLAINEKVSELTHLNISFEALKLTAVPPGISLYGAKIATDVSPHEHILKAGQISAYVSIWGLFLGEPRLSSVDARDVELIWPPPWNFEGFMKNELAASSSNDDPVAWPPDFAVPIEQLKLSNFDAFIEYPIENTIPKASSWATFGVNNANLNIEIDDWDDIHAFVEVKSLDAAIDENSLIEATKFEANFELDDKTIIMSRLLTNGNRLKSQGSLFAELLTSKNKLPLKSSNRAESLDSINIKSSSSFKADLSLLGTFLQTANTRGPVNGEVNLDMTIPVNSKSEFELKLNGKGKVQDAYLDGFRLYDSLASFELKDDGFYLNGVDVMIGETSFGKGKGKILFNDKVNYDFAFSPDSLHLMDLLDIFGVDFDAFDTQLTSPDLKLKGTGVPFNMTVNATGLFSDMDTPATPYKKKKFKQSPACILQVSLNIDSSGLVLDGSEGHCFTYPAGKKIPVKPKQTIPKLAQNISPLALSGPIHFSEKGMNMQIKSTNIDLSLANHFAQIPLQGIGLLHTAIKGPYSKIAIITKAKIREAQISEIPLGNLAASTRIIDGKLYWDEITSTLQENSYLQLLEGELAFDKELILSSRLNAHNIPKSFSEGLSASFYPDAKLLFKINNASANLKGSIFYPLAMHGNFAADLQDISNNDVKLVDRLTVDLDSNEKGWRSSIFQASLGSFILDTDFQHKRAFPFSFEEAQTQDNFWTSIGLHPDDEIGASFDTEIEDGTTKSSDNHVALIPYAGQILTNSGIAGKLRLKGKIRGTTDEIQGAVEGEISNTSVLGSKIAPIKFNGFIKKSQLDLVINHGGNSFEGRLSMDLMKDKIPYEWYFNFNRTDLRFAATEHFSTDPRNFLYLTADWHMKGHFGDFWKSNGELKVTDIRGKFVQDLGGQTRAIDIQQDEPIQVDFSKDGWKIVDDKALFLNARNLRVRLSLPNCKPPENLGIKATTIIDLGLLKEFSSDIDSATGKLRIITEIKGPADDLDISLNVSDFKRNPFIASTWRPVQVGLAMIRPAFRNVQVEAVYKDDRLLINHLSANKGAGAIKANGSLNFDKTRVEPSRIDVNFKDTTLIFPVAVLKSFETLISGNVAVTGNGFPFKIGGDINVVRARSTKEVDIRNEIFDALRRSSFRTELATEKPAFFFDLNIDADKSINIHNRNIKAVMSADLQLQGSDIAPQVLGQVEVNRGEFNYKRDFNIVRGIVTFDDPVKPDPSLDILAEADVGAYKVYITATGRASNPQIEYSTDPPTREDGTPIGKLETLILLSKGDLPKEGKSFADSQNAALSEGINIVMSQVESPFEKILDKTGQDVVRTVYFDTYSDGGSPEPRMNVPLDLGEDFDLIFKFHETGNEIASEYSLVENVTLSGKVEDREADEAKSTTSTGNASVDLKFRFSFE